MKKLLEVKAWFAAIDRAGGANFPDVRPAPIRGEEPSAKNLRDRRRANRDRAHDLHADRALLPVVFVVRSFNLAVMPAP